MDKECVIFAGGDMSENIPNIELRVKSADYIICADSGLKHAQRLGITPDIIVGDFDSYTGKLPDNSEIIRSIPEKDDTDTIMAVRKAAELGCRQIVLYGALGGSRFEHTVANIQTLLFAKELGCILTIIDKSVICLQYNDGEEYYYQRSENGTYMSVFSLSETTEIEYLDGVKYPLENYTMKNSYPIGVSNEITETCAVLKIKSGTALIILTDK